MNIRERVLGDGNSFANFGEKPKADLQAENAKLKSIAAEFEERFNVLYGKYCALEKEFAEVVASSKQVIENGKNKKRKY